jgi:hypothetical protein
VSAPHPWGDLHLLVADDALVGEIGGTYLAVCGELVPASTLPPSSCPEDCDCDVLYCPECVRAVAQSGARVPDVRRGSGPPWTECGCPLRSPVPPCRRADVPDPGPPGGHGAPLDSGWPLVEPSPVQLPTASRSPLQSLSNPMARRRTGG